MATRQTGMDERKHRGCQICELCVEWESIQGLKKKKKQELDRLALEVLVGNLRLSRCFLGKARRWIGLR